MPALTFAATIDRILNGLTRPFFGWISDMIGRENTMFIAFLMEGVGIYALYKLGADPVWFVLLSGFVFFAWGEIYSLFPSTCTDTFGTKFAATNAGLLYTAKGTAALLVPYGNSIQAATKSWDVVFQIAAGANILAAVLALFVLKPWRQKVVARSSAQADATAAAGGAGAASVLRQASRVLPALLLAWLAGSMAMAGVGGATAHSGVEELAALKQKTAQLTQKLFDLVGRHDAVRPQTVPEFKAAIVNLEERIAWYEQETIDCRARRN